VQGCSATGAVQGLAHCVLAPAPYDLRAHTEGQPHTHQKEPCTVCRLSLHPSCPNSGWYLWITCTTCGGQQQRGTRIAEQELVEVKQLCEVNSEAL
jgi:hypothetical protein